MPRLVSFEIDSTSAMGTLGLLILRNLMTSPVTNHPLRAFDPRYFQIATLAALVTYGITILQFPLGWIFLFVVPFTALSAQALLSRFFGIARVEYKSALISALSLCLLLRTSALWIAVLVTLSAIGSKFLLRVNGKHVFNPTNFGLVVGLLATSSVWIQPGQWGSEVVFAGALACAGFAVLARAGRFDITFLFLGAWSCLLFYRAWWLGDPFTIPLHQLENGGLLIFAFFMISDPRSTPDSSRGRVVFALLVAAVAYYIRFKRFEPNALLYALALVSPLTPVFDQFWRGKEYQWSDRVALPSSVGMPSSR